MSKRKKIIAFYHFENYIQIQKLNYILKTFVNYNELTPRAEKIKALHTIETNWGIRICCQARVPTLFSHREKVRKSMFKLHVQCSNQCSKYFQILLVSKS